MSKEELTSEAGLTELTKLDIKKYKIDKLKENYDKKSFNYKILENISYTFLIKRLLLEIENLKCDSEENPIDQEKILKLLLITSEDEQLLDEGFKDEHDILQWIIDADFIKGLLETSGIDKLPDCGNIVASAELEAKEAKETGSVGGRRRQQAETSKTKMRSHRSKKRSKKSSKKRSKKRSKREIR
jgi:hypothetical protein